MSETIYAPPEADIVVTTSAEADFYVVAPRKFYLLSILTFNVYFAYWFYRNWHLIKQSTGESMWPPMRGLFFIFFTHALLTDVDEKIKSLGKSYVWRPGTIATLVVLLIVLVNVLDRLSGISVASPTTELISIALVPIIPAILVKAQNAINFACDDPTGSVNRSLTLVNCVWMVLGALLWLLVLIGVYALILEPELFVE